MYTAIQANTSNSVITRLWLDDSLTQMIIPAGGVPWDFSMVEVYRLTGCYSNQQFAYDCTILNPRKFQDLNLSFTADNQIVYSTPNTFYFVNTIVSIDQVLTADSPIFLINSKDSNFIFSNTTFNVAIATTYNYFCINASTGTNFFIQNGCVFNNIFYSTNSSVLMLMLLMMIPLL